MQGILRLCPNIKSYIEQQISNSCRANNKRKHQKTLQMVVGLFIFDEIERIHGLVVKENNGIGTLLLDAILKQR